MKNFSLLEINYSGIVVEIDDTFDVEEYKQQMIEKLISMIDSQLSE
jgi:hypothetical protein